MDSGRIPENFYSTNGFFWREDGSRELVYGLGDQQDSMTFADLARGCFYGVGATYRRELFDSVGGYRVSVFGEDYDFWLRAMVTGARHCYLSQPLSLHRLSATQKSARLDRLHREDISVLTDLKRNSHLSDEQRAAIDEGVLLRRRLLSRWEPLRRVSYRAWMTVATPILGQDRARRAPRVFESFLREHLFGSGHS